MIIIQCATGLEFESLRQSFSNRPVQRLNKIPWFEAVPGVVVYRGGVGARAAGAATRQAVAKWSPSVVFDFGAAGALTEQLRVGDLVLADEVVVDGETGSVFKTGSVPEAWANVPGHPQFSVISGGLRATRGKLVAVSGVELESPEERRALAERTGAIAVCWETHAIGTVCQELGVGLMAARVISDIGEGELKQEYQAKVSGALRTASYFLSALIRSGGLVG